VSITCAVGYLLLLCLPVLRNSYEFVYKQSRYSVWAVLSYYISMVIFLVLSITTYTFFAVGFLNGDAKIQAVAEYLLLIILFLRYAIVMAQATNMFEFVLILRAEIKKGKDKLDQDIIEKDC